MLWVREVGDRGVAVILRYLGRFDKKIHLIEIFVYPLAFIHRYLCSELITTKTSEHTWTVALFLDALPGQYLYY